MSIDLTQADTDVVVQALVDTKVKLQNRGHTAKAAVVGELLCRLIEVELSEAVSEEGRS